MADLFSNLEKSLLEKFDSVTIQPTSKIAKEDEEYCILKERQYHLVLKQLSEWQKVMEEGYKSEGENIHYSLEERPGRMPYVSRNLRNDDNDFRQFMFTPLYDICHIKGLEEKAKYSFIGTIETYFEKKYNLKLDLERDKYINSNIKYKTIVEHIILKCGGLSLVESGENKVIDDFNNTIYWSENWEIKNNNIYLIDYCWFENYSSRLKFSYRDERQMKLRKALSYFETGEVKDIAFDIQIEYVDTTEEYRLNNFTKIESVKYYKNRKLQIKFKSNEFAKEFVERFKLTQIKSR